MPISNIGDLCDVAPAEVVRILAQVWVNGNRTCSENTPVHGDYNSHYARLEPQLHPQVSPSNYLGLVNYDELRRFSMIQPDRFCLVFAMGATEVAPPACGQLQHFPLGVASSPPLVRSALPSRQGICVDLSTNEVPVHPIPMEYHHVP